MKLKEKEVNFFLDNAGAKPRSSQMFKIENFATKLHLLAMAL